MIKKIISEILYKNNLSFSWKDDNWDLLLNEINDSKFFSSNYINYQIKYLKFLQGCRRCFINFL